MNKWDTLTPVLLQSIGETVYMVAVSLLIAGVAGLAIGALLYATRPDNLFENRVVFFVANLVINVIRPIPFIIFLTAVAPVTRAVTGTTLGTDAAIVPITIMATVVIARVVEQNLVAVDPGTVEAARAVGARRIGVLFGVVIRRRSRRSSSATRSCSSRSSTCRRWRVHRRRRPRQLRDHLRLPAVQPAGDLGDRRDHRRGRAAGQLVGNALAHRILRR